ELDAADAAVGSEDPEPDEHLLVAATTGAAGAGMCPSREQRVRPETGDVIVTEYDVVGDLQNGAKLLPECFGPTREPGSEDPVIDDLHVGRPRCRVAIGMEWAVDGRRDRTCRRRGAVARGPGGEQLGVALVQPHDRVAQPVGGEPLHPPASSVRIHLDHDEYVRLVGADIELPTREPARRPRQAAERERGAEGGERL